MEVLKVTRIETICILVVLHVLIAEKGVLLGWLSFVAFRTAKSLMMKITVLTGAVGVSVAIAYVTYGLWLAGFRYAVAIPALTATVNLLRLETKRSAARG